MIALAAVLLAAAAPTPRRAAEAPEALKEDALGADDLKLRAAERLFEDRLDPDLLDAAIEALARLAKDHPGAAHPRLLLARAEAFWSDLHPEATPDAAEAHLRVGVRAAEEALALANAGPPDAASPAPGPGVSLAEVTVAGAEPLYWLAADQHRLAARHGLDWLLLEADDLRQLFHRVVELAPATYHGGAHRHLAELDLALPQGFGRSLTDATAKLAAAAALGPTFLPTHLAWASRLAVKAQDYKTFQRELRTVLDAPPDLDPEAWPENELARRQARALLLHPEDLFTRAALAAHPVR